MMSIFQVRNFDRIFCLGGHRRPAGKNSYGDRINF